jgi:hypothetical protein
MQGFSFRPNVEVIQRGDVRINAIRTFRDYLADYHAKVKHEEVAPLRFILSGNPITSYPFAWVGHLATKSAGLRP